MLIVTVFVNFTLNAPVQTVLIPCSAPNLAGDEAFPLQGIECNRFPYKNARRM